MLLAEQNTVIVEFVAGHEVVDARHLVGGVGDRLRCADARTFAAKELSERRVAAVERLGCHAQRLRRAVDAGTGVRADHLAAGDRRELILKCLLDGTSVRAAARIADTDENTVLRLLVDAGRVSAAYQDRVLRNLPCKRIEVDEIWAFVYAKAKNLPWAKSPPPMAGDVYTWTAMCRDTKLMVSWRVGDRGADTRLGT